MGDTTDDGSDVAGSKSTAGLNGSDWEVSVTTTLVDVGDSIAWSTEDISIGSKETHPGVSLLSLAAGLSWLPAHCSAPRVAVRLVP